MEIHFPREECFTSHGRIAEIIDLDRLKVVTTTIEIQIFAPIVGIPFQHNLAADIATDILIGTGSGHRLLQGIPQTLPLHPVCGQHVHLRHNQR